MELEKNFSLHFMLLCRQLQEAQKKDPTVLVVVLSFPFHQILTNQPQNRQRRTSKENYWQKNIHRRTYTEEQIEYTTKIYTEEQEPPLPISLSNPNI